MNNQIKIIKVDAKNQNAGRLASKVAFLLQGKHLASYQPNIFGNIRVEINNLKDIKFTGQKLSNKIYFKYTGYVGHLKKNTLNALWTKNPEKTFKLIVSKMLPKNKHRALMLKNIIIK